MEDTYMKMVEKNDAETKDARVFISKLIAVWNKMYDSMVHNISDNETNAKKYSGYKDTLNEINTLLTIINNATDDEFLVFGNLNILNVLRNLPVELTKPIIDAIYQDYDEYNYKLHAACGRLREIFDSNRVLPLVFNKNLKKLNKINTLYTSFCDIEVKQELNDTLDHPSSLNMFSVKGLFYFITKILGKEKKLIKRCYPETLIIPGRLEPNYAGRIKIEYTEEQLRLIEYMDKCNNQKIKDKIINYLHAYNEYYLHGLLSGKLDIILYDGLIDRSRMNNTMREIGNLKIKIDQNMNVLRTKMEKDYELVLALLEKEKKPTKSRLIGTKDEIVKEYHDSEDLRGYFSKTLSENEKTLAKKAGIQELDNEYIFYYSRMVLGFNYELASLKKDSAKVRNPEVAGRLQKIVDKYTRIGLGYRIISEYIKENGLNRYISITDKDKITMEFYKYIRIIGSLRLSKAPEEEINKYINVINALGDNETISSLYAKVMKEGLEKYRALCEQYCRIAYQIITSTKNKMTEYDNVKWKMRELVVEYNLDDEMMDQIEEETKTKFVFQYEEVTNKEVLGKTLSKH